VGAPDHPHRGQTTVSYILSGELEHHDSAGHKGKLSAGWVQWMDAASGVVHSEMPSEKMQKEGGTLEGFQVTIPFFATCLCECAHEIVAYNLVMQIWVNLPAAKKLNPPRYQDVSPDLIPSVRIPGASSEESVVKVIAGQALGTTGPVETTTPILYYDLILQPGDSFTQEIPEGYNLLSYVYRGKGQFGAKNTVAEEGTMVKFGSGSTLQVTAAKDSFLKCLVLGGAPIGEPVVSHGPFVMNTEEEIYQAFEDYRAGKLGTIEGAEAR
jgi:redox-sensitive bicupin YhaK (pirin superfamily)